MPVVIGLVISFCKWDFYTAPKFVGLLNYKEILINRDGYFYSEFWNGLMNTLKYVAFSVPFLVFVPLLIAVGINVKTKGAQLFLSIFYLPSLLSVATVCLTWNWMFERSFGIINQVLHMDIPWTMDQPYAWIAIVAMSVWWGIGGNMIIFLAGIADIPEELYEAASIDGANSVNKFLKITLPGLRNQMLYTFIMTTVASFNIYGQPLMVTKGGPSKSTSVLMMTIQSLAFGADTPAAGLASSMAVILGVFIIIVSLFQFKVMKNES